MYSKPRLYHNSKNSIEPTNKYDIYSVNPKTYQEQNTNRFDRYSNLSPIRNTFKKISRSQNPKSSVVHRKHQYNFALNTSMSDKDIFKKITFHKKKYQTGGFKGP